VVESRFLGNRFSSQGEVGHIVDFSIFFLFFSYYPMVTSNIVLPKLISINLFYWSKHMQPIFITKDLWELVIDGYIMPFVDEFKSLSVDDKKYLKELINKDNEAISLIGSAIEESVFLRISFVDHPNRHRIS
jgi:hypothetical protein